MILWSEDYDGNGRRWWSGIWKGGAEGRLFSIYVLPDGLFAVVEVLSDRYDRRDPLRRCESEEKKLARCLTLARAKDAAEQEIGSTL